MKYSIFIVQAILLTMVMGYERGEPNLKFMGRSEFDVYDFVEGWASGWFRGGDKRDTWGECVEGIPNIFL